MLSVKRCPRFSSLPNLIVVRVCIFACTRGNTEIFAQIETDLVTYPLDKVIRPLNNWTLVAKYCYCFDLNRRSSSLK